MFALLLVVLLGFAALVVDVGLMANSRSNLQKTADAAALAAAMDLPNTTKVNTTANYFVDLNANSGVGRVITPDIPQKRVRVTVNESVEHFFAKVLGINSSTIEATAVAEKREKWAGEALPFVNLDDVYSPGAEIVAWEDVAPGTFESLWPDEYEYTTIDGMVSFSLDYEDGLEVTQGVVATIKQEIEAVQSQGTPVYLFSLRNDLIADADYIDDIKNRSNIPLSDLVLLQVTFDEFNFGGNKDMATLTVLQVFDINNDEFPEEFLLDPKVTSILVE